MADEKRGWKQVQNLTFDRKKISKRVKKAEGATIRHAHKFILSRLDSIRTVRRHIIVWLLLVGVMIATVGLQFVWFRQSYQTTAAAIGGAYAEASLGPIDTLNPLYAASSAEVDASRLLFSSLYTYDKTGHLHGDLARDMQVDQSNTIYTIKIRSDAKWHDGMRLTAKDVAFTVNLIKNPQTRSQLRVIWQDVKVTAPNDTTVQFQLPAVYAAFPHALTFSVLPEHLLANVAAGAVRENTFSRSPIGSGPFSFRLLQTVSSGGVQHKIAYMNAFDKYYDGTPKLSHFEIHAYSTTDAILQALRTGEVNAATDLSGRDVKQVDTTNYETTAQPINSGVYALFNNDVPILKDKAVRQALQLVTNTTTIRNKLGDGVPALDLPFINGQLTGSDVPHASVVDVVKAGQLLDADGWLRIGAVRKKGDQNLAITITTIKNSQYENALETLAGQWRELGVAVTTNIVDQSDPTTNFVQNTLQARNYDVLLYELFIGADPDVYAYWHSSQIGMNGYNFSDYANKVADASLTSARARLEPELRNAKYKTFARQWLDDVPAIGLYQSVSEYVASRHAQSINPVAKLISAQDRYSSILDWTVNQNSVYKTP